MSLLAVGYPAKLWNPDCYEDFEEKAHVSHRPTNNANTNDRQSFESESKERLRQLGADREGECWSPRWSCNDPTHCVPRTTLEKLDTTGYDTCSRHIAHHHRDVRDSVLGA